VVAFLLLDYIIVKSNVKPLDQGHPIKDSGSTIYELVLLTNRDTVTATVINFLHR